MSQTIQARSLPIIGRQVVDLPQHAKLLDVHLDIRHNNCLLWTLEDKERAVEKVEIIMLTMDQALTPENARYVGNFKGNAGVWQVFALRASERLFA